MPNETKERWTIDPALKHFCRLAEAGSNAWASDGEKHAHKLLHAMMEHAGGLDDQALYGAGLFLRIARLDPKISLLVAMETE